MAQGFSVQVIGSAKLLKQLERLDPAANKRIKKRIGVDIADLMVANIKGSQIGGGGRGRAKAVPPIYGRITSRTGNLRSSIDHLKGTGKVLRIVGVTKSGDASDADARVYGPLHELGLGRFPKRAFVFPAISATFGKWSAVVFRAWSQESGLT